MVSKRGLFFALNFVFKMLGKKAASSFFSFLKPKGAEEFINHYQRVRAGLKTLGSSLKAAVEAEATKKDDMTGHMKEIRYQRLAISVTRLLLSKITF